MKTLRLSLTNSDGTSAEVPYTLPDSLRFDCFVPGVGMCSAFVNLGSDQVDVVDVLQYEPSRTISIHWTGTDAEAAVLEQAGDMCDFFDDAGFMGSKPSCGVRLKSDEVLLTTIADLALCEKKQREAVASLGKDMFRTGLPSAMPQEEHWTLSATAMRGFVGVLVERAQTLATKAARRRQEKWEAQQSEHLREERLASAAERAS